MVALFVLGLGMVISTGILIHSFYKTKEATPPNKVEKHSYRAAYHFTSPDHWKNDAEAPLP